MKDKLLVVVPIYKPNLDLYEKKSLQNNLKILEGRLFAFVYPNDLDISYYQELVGRTQVLPRFIAFKSFYFASIEGYNKLLLSTCFYEQFKNFDYILICQTDTYVFRDELSEWIKKGYDYVGAPWVDWYWSEFYARHLTFPRRMLYRMGKRKFNYVGNGGFSLRKVSSFINNLRIFDKGAASFSVNEDFFFSYFINSYNPFFKVAPFRKALGFAFDENPEKAFEMNHCQLPMACHAWPKYHDSFWKNYIKI